MWNYLYELWRSVLRHIPRNARSEPPEDDSPRNALREELRRLLEERATLQKTIASYQEFGYDELADRVRDDLAAADRRIGAIRHELRRPPAAPDRRRTGPSPR
ncbi:MAG TPA: hypothetical protein VNM14_02185 [Planctomycetota bacterium]|jgi:hypothetical protein|nr:hypothetical protein [Planctomycetota bacterium]